MEDELSPFIENNNIIVSRQYIDNESALEQKYGSKVPVLMCDGEVLCEYYLDTDKLRSIINRSHN
jgi:hypothetical protein